ncbi:MAG: polysaccharide biosynthesis/export family protein [Candidatus Riflebacteria bacterium]
MKRKQWYLIFLISLFTASMLNAAPEVINSGDIISVWVKGEPELTVERQVGTDGSIAYPLIGNIGLNNLKTSDAAKLIAELLEDGYLREPLVQVTIKSGKGRSKAGKAVAAPLNEEKVKAESADQVKPVLIEVIDSSSRKGIGGVAMMLGNRIYQSNKLGQILIEGQEGRIVVIADGYELLNGDISQHLKPGNPQKIVLDKVRLPQEIVFHVLDAFTRQPIAGVDVALDTMKISTSKNGTFKIKKLQKEFGEVSLSKKGYKQHRMVVDFKGPQEQLILMVRNE